MKNFWKTNPLKKNKPFDEKTFEKKKQPLFTKRNQTPVKKKNTKQTSWKK